MCIRDRVYPVGSALNYLGPQPDVALGGELDGVADQVGKYPVSYTHLDVYKRQR